MIGHKVKVPSMCERACMWTGLIDVCGAKYNC